VHTARDEHREYAGTPGNRPFDYLSLVRRTGNDGDAPLERIELVHALLPAHADDVVAPVERVPHQILPELARGPDDADPHDRRVTRRVLRGPKVLALPKIRRRRAER
jgi:hypothetical protein